MSVSAGFGAGRVLGVFAAVLLLSAVPIVPAAGEGGVVRVVPHADLQNLDPINTTAGIAQSHGLMVYDLLFGRDAKLQPLPQMIESFEVDQSGLVYRFRLRDGLAFHDGASVTTADVIASLKRWGARDTYGRQIFGATASLDAIDAQSFVWTLRHRYGLLLDALAKSGGNIPAIMPARVAATDPFKAITETVGSGPFIFSKEEWQPGSRVVYRRNSAYRPRPEPAEGTAGGKRVKVDRVEWVNVADAQTAINALVAGEIDYVENPPADYLPILRSRGMSVVTTNQLGFQGMLRMNHLHPPFDQPKARQALLYLVDQEEHMRAMFSDPSLWRTCHAFFVCGSPLETDAGVDAQFGKDPEKAKRLFAEAGYAGQPLVIMHPTDVGTMNAATLVLADELKRIGIKVELQAMDFATMAQRRANKKSPAEGGWNIGFTYWNGLGASDPIGNAPMQASCDKAWPGWPCDAEHQALIDAFPLAQKLEERRTIAAQIQQSAYRLVPYVPIGQWFTPIAHGPSLKGVLPVPQVMVFWNLEKAGGR